MTSRQYVLPIVAVAILWAGMLFLARVQSSVAPSTPTQPKPKRTGVEREARLAQARDPVPTANTPINPDHTIVGHWVPMLVDIAGQKLLLYADGTFDLWQYSCINIYDDYPIHGCYLFDGTEVQLGVEERLDRFVWNHAWCLWKYEGETFLVPKSVIHTLDLNDSPLPWCLQYREIEWDEAEHRAFVDAMFKRYNERIPADACYTENSDDSNVGH